MTYHTTICHPDELGQCYYVIRMTYAFTLKSSGWDSKFRFSITRGGPSALPYPTNWSEELSGGPEHPNTAASDGPRFYLVFCGIRCPVNLHQPRSAILKMSPKILLPPPQAPRCSSSNSAWLPMPMPRALFAINKMQNETVPALWHCTFGYMNMSYYFSHRFNRQCYTDIDCLWLPRYCPCSILTEWMIST